MRISVAVPARARPEYLAEAVGSIASQTRRPDEVIVSEDGADEDIAAVLAQAPIPIQHVVNLPELGQLENRRQAFRLTTGELVAMLDDDDRWSPDFLATMEHALLNHPECAFASSDHWWMGVSGEVMQEETELASRRFGRSKMADGVYRDVLARTLQTAPFALNVTLFRRAVLERLDFFPVHAGTAPDFALMLSLGAEGESAVYVNKRLGSYRVHPGQQISASGRIANSSSRVESLRAVFPYTVSALRPLVSRRYREAALEHAIALAHERRRGEALRALRAAWAIGLGGVPPRRVAVLLASLAGISR